jgi:hypothetical protein
MRRRTGGPCREGGAESNRSGKRNFYLGQHFQISYLSIMASYFRARFRAHRDQKGCSGTSVNNAKASNL